MSYHSNLHAQMQEEEYEQIDQLIEEEELLARHTINEINQKNRQQKYDNVDAVDILDKAVEHLADRAKDYDLQAVKERSMPDIVKAFNAVTGHQLAEEEGWLFMILLKMVRSQQGNFKLDNYEDGAAYFALMGECAYNSERNQ